MSRRTTAILVPLPCLTASAAEATEARKTGLARSYLQVDDADLFLYPGMMGE